MKLCQCFVHRLIRVWCICRIIHAYSVFYISTNISSLWLDLFLLWSEISVLTYINILGRGNIRSNWRGNLRGERKGRGWEWRWERGGGRIILGEKVRFSMPLITMIIMIVIIIIMLMNCNEDGTWRRTALLGTAQIVRFLLSCWVLVIKEKAMLFPWWPTVIWNHMSNSFQSI